MDRRGFLSRGSLGLAAGMAPTTVRRAAAQTTRKRELVVAQSFDVTSLDPHGSTLSNDWRVAFNLFDTLVRRHPAPGPRDCLEADDAHDLAARPAARRALARRDAVHLGRRQVQSRPDP
jgi:ABC-type transport system substrate-binding protein